MATSPVGQALVDFSLDGLFPQDNNVSSLPLTPDRLPDAIQTLAAARSRLEADIRTIVDETAGDVRTWIANARALQTDMTRRKTLANDILVRADDHNGHTPLPGSAQAIAEAENRAQFLTNELNYNLQVRYLLEAIRSINQLLDRVEQAAGERRILDALHMLARSWTALDAMPVNKSCRAMRLLDLRAFELRSSVHVVLDHVWGALVHVDPAAATLTVVETRPDEPMSLSDTVIGLQAYKEVDDRMVDLWHALDTAIITPRMDLERASRPAIFVDDAVLGIRGEAGPGITALFTDLDLLFSFLAVKLPSDLVHAISSVMMPDLVARVTDVWLASAVPTALDEMATFEETIQAAVTFCKRLDELQYAGFGRLQEWIENAPRVWLSKRRETALDTVRKRIAEGLGTPQEVERVERHMVSRSEGKELAAAEQSADWDAAWSDEEKETEESQEPQEKETEEPVDDGADAWAAWGDEGEVEVEPEVPEMPEAPEASEVSAEEKKEKETTHTDEDDAAEAWGWGDEANDEQEEEPQPPVAVPTIQEPPKSPKAKTKTKEAKKTTTTAAEPTTRELVLKETYHISSLPAPLLALIAGLLEDGAVLLSEDYAHSPVAAAAAGLFSLPTLALALFRAVAPYYYAADIGGSMYLYNDAMYLAERLKAVAADWKARADVGPRAQALLRLDGETKKLQAFASRAYGHEMAVQKMVLRDLLGGDQNVLVHGSDDGMMGGSVAGGDDDEAAGHVDAAVARVRSMAVAWEDILGRSAWRQAVGALVETVATKMIGDVLEMTSISQDEAFSLASLIARVTELDDLFGERSEDKPEKGERSEDKTEKDERSEDQDKVPMTAQYVPSWLRMQYLSELLQSNLREVRFLWMESELSLYFTAEEVIDLVRLSFSDSSKSRKVIHEISQNPHPVAV